MTEPQLRELEAICERATPGKWGTFQCTPFDSLLVNAPGRNVCALPGWNHRPDEREADAHFIATARTALPAALAEIRRLKAALREACELHAESVTVSDEIDRDDILDINSRLDRLDAIDDRIATLRKEAES